MSIRGVIMAKRSGEDWRELMPFVGLNPDRALSDVMKKGFVRAKFVPHKKGDGDGVA